MLGLGIRRCHKIWDRIRQGKCARRAIFERGNPRTFTESTRCTRFGKQVDTTGSQSN